MTDIIERLRYAKSGNEPLNRLFEDAITEIEELRAVCGATMSRKAFRDIKQEIKDGTAFNG